MVSDVRIRSVLLSKIFRIAGGFSLFPTAFYPDFMEKGTRLRQVPLFVC